jgi:hypothetical protein
MQVNDNFSIQDKEKIRRNYILSRFYRVLEKSNEHRAGKKRKGSSSLFYLLRNREVVSFLPEL